MSCVFASPLNSVFFNESILQNVNLKKLEERPVEVQINQCWEISNEVTL